MENPNLFEHNHSHVHNTNLNPIFYTLEEWKYELEYLGYRKCDKCGKVNSTLVESVNYSELICYQEQFKEELLIELSNLKGFDYSDKTFKKSIRELEVDLNNSQTGLNNCKDEVVRKRYEILIEGYEKDLKEQKWGHEFGKKRTEDKIPQIEEKLQKIEEEIKMLEKKRHRYGTGLHSEESPYYCDECEDEDFRNEIME